MAYEDFTTYDETDEGNNVAKISSKVSWNDLARTHTSHVSDSKGAAYFDGDFEHKFECQFSNVVGTGWCGFWILANTQADAYALGSASADYALFYYARAEDKFELQIAHSGSFPVDTMPNPVVDTTYYITLSRDDDAGVNNTGQYIAEIRTGSHTGTLVDTLTVDCVADGQDDFEFVYGLISYDDNTGIKTIDGFTQNLDLQEAPVGAAGAMTPNTGYWGPVV